MFDRLEIFQIAHGMATHASARQAVIASNIANADTPGYKARDIAPFALNANFGSGSSSLRSTRDGHLDAVNPGTMRFQSFDRPDGLSPNENSVSLETELVEAAQVQKSHELALTVYQSALGILRSSVRGAR